MTKPAALPTLEFSEAKSHLSDVMTGVVRDSHPTIVTRFRGKEEMLLLPRPVLDQWLAVFRFEPLVAVDSGEVTAALHDFGLLGFGTTLDEALDDLLERLREHTARFFDRAAYYMAGPMARQAPWLLRFALTAPDRQRELLTEPPGRSWTATIPATLEE